MSLLLPQNPTPSPGGVRFVDERKRDRGGANLVTRREQPTYGLTILDVVGADQALTQFLWCLDRKRLVVEARAGGAAMFRFRWASGYSDGTSIKIQGMLEHP